MCCFSKVVKNVANTSIFGRVGAKGNQILIYSMSLDADEDLAMILPIPVKEETPENGLQFINLSEYSELFDEIEEGFPQPFLSRQGSLRVDSFGAKLEVKQVGSFEASFVPGVKDFGRLDERFRLAQGVWEKLPQYANFGFAVFKLRAGEAKVHPMAFAFPTATPESIFFPTVHIHDGKVHEREEFDHALYCQTRSSTIKINWSESTSHAGNFVSYKKVKGMIRPNEHIYKVTMSGMYDNKDVIIPAT